MRSFIFIAYIFLSISIWADVNTATINKSIISDNNTNLNKDSNISIQVNINEKIILLETILKERTKDSEIIKKEAYKAQLLITGFGLILTFITALIALLGWNSRSEIDKQITLLKTSNDEQIKKLDDELKKQTDKVDEHINQLNVVAIQNKILLEQRRIIEEEIRSLREQLVNEITNKIYDVIEKERFEAQKRELEARERTQI